MCHIATPVYWNAMVDKKRIRSIEGKNMRGYHQISDASQAGEEITMKRLFTLGNKTFWTFTAWSWSNK